MTARAHAHCDDAMRWLKARGWSLAPLTGQDAPCLRAIAHLWSMYFRSDGTGQRAVLLAVAALLEGCQECVWPMARELIAHAGDWSHRDELWPRVVTMFNNRGDYDRTDRLAHCHINLKLVQGGAQ